MTSSPPEGCSERASSMDTASPTKAARGPWRSVGASVMSAGVPTAVGIVHPFIGVGMAIVELVVALAVVSTALFGSPELSERAFRLLRWIANRAEPLAPPRGPEDYGNAQHRSLGAQYLEAEQPAEQCAAAAEARTDTAQASAERIRQEAAWSAIRSV